MSTTFRLGGDVTSALTHFALAGLGQIARSLSTHAVELSWSDETVPRAVITTEDVTVEAMAEEVLRLADSWTGGWTTIRHEYGEGTFSPFSPRFKSINAEKYPADWASHQNVRNETFDKLAVDRDGTALRLIHALGEAAYWRFDGKSPRPDHGASRWEMKTRNKGQEFVRDRLHLLCKELAGWDSAQVIDGLSGATVNDSLSKNSLDSRTSTGFTPPGPADVALTFAAIVGISQFPVTHRIHELSVTPGAYPTNTLHPKFMVLPVPTVPITPERYANIVCSLHWSEITAEIGAHNMGKDIDSLQSADHRAVLRARGVPAAAVFRINLGGSPSAPERYIEQGQVQLL